MKALVMDAVGKPMAVKDFPQPECSTDGAIVRVQACGICRSDWHMWMGDWTWIGFTSHFPTVLGHEFAGVIEEVGKDVKKLKRGDRVVAPLSQACGTCEDCTSGHSNLCFGGSSAGGFGQFAKLGYADYNTVRLTEAIDFVEGASMGCRYVTAYHAIMDQARVKADESVVIYGCGGVGLSAAQIAASVGARVIAVDLDDRKLELAKRVGACDVVNGKNTDPVAAVKDLTHGGAHVSVDALGIAATCQNALMSLRKLGRHVQIGLTTQKEKGQVALPIDLIVLAELQIMGSSSIPTWRYPAMLEMVERGKLSPKQLVTNAIPLSKAFEVIDQMSRFENVGISVIDQF
jgi:D-arabinose 1-dehydrogenase-like Zn-dependent alcohol dehydrogenase